jgi:hypothetical protein
MSWLKKQETKDPYDMSKNDNYKFEVTGKQLKNIIDQAAIEGLRKADESMDQLIKLLKVHRLSILLSNRSLQIIERIKARYPYIWNECTDENDSLFVADLLKQLGDNNVCG